MKILVLGGCGIQGRASVYDLSIDDSVEEVICADNKLENLKIIDNIADMSKVKAVALDAADLHAISTLLETCDVAISLLPRQFNELVCQAAIKTGVSVVNANYAYSIKHLDKEAAAANIAIMPECGLDPGIDLVIYGHAARDFEKIHLLNSYCGGFPELTACDNPLKYKTSWVWEGVLSSLNREARIVRGGEVMDISAEKQHLPEMIHEIEFPGLGTLEAIPNGDALFFTDLIGVTGTIRETGRYTLRWPGWSAFWRPLKALGFLDERPVEGLPSQITPYMFMDKHLGPRLQYKDNEKDIVAMINIFEGIKDGINTRATYRMLIKRNLQTGLVAMSQGVGFPVAIIARMIARGEIANKGLLRPSIHIPYESFVKQLAERGIQVEEFEEPIG